MTQYFKKETENELELIFSMYKEEGQEFMEVFSTKEGDDMPTTLDGAEEITLDEFLDLGSQYSLFKTTTQPPLPGSPPLP